MPSTRTRAALFTTLSAGAILRTVQYGAVASLSSDEAAIALNVMDRGLRDLLLRPLDQDQMAPLGFLVLEKLSVWIGGNGEAALRFLPYVMSLVSLVLFWKVAARYLGTWTLLAASFVFALSPAMILYAGVAKQYSGDIVVTLLLLWMALRLLEGPVPAGNAATLALGGGVAILFSQPAVLVAAGLGAVLLLDGWLPGRSVRDRFAVCAGWAAGATAVTATSLLTYASETAEYMDGVWRTGFVPAPWRGIAELFWVPAKLAEAALYAATYIYTPGTLPTIGLAGLYGLLGLLGAVYLVRRDRRTALLLLVPILVAVLAAVVRLLPISGRISLFLGPSLIIAAFAGFDGVRTWLPRRLGGLVPAAALGFALVPTVALLASKPPPRILSGTRPVLRHVRDDWRPEDRLFVSRGRWTLVSLEYYGRRLGIGGWTHLDRLEGRHTAEEFLRGYLTGIDGARGAPRVWLYLEGTVPCEDEAMVGYLDAIGRRLDWTEFRINRANRVSAWLYDLSDPRLLERSSAATYPVPACVD